MNDVTNSQSNTVNPDFVQQYIISFPPSKTIN